MANISANNPTCQKKANVLSKKSNKKPTNGTVPAPPKFCYTYFNTLAQLSQPEKCPLLAKSFSKNNGCIPCRISFRIRKKIDTPPFWAYIHVPKRPVFQWVRKCSYLLPMDIPITRETITTNYLHDSYYHNTTEGHIYSSDGVVLDGSKDILYRKAKAKYFSKAVAFHLADLESCMNDSYVSSLSCCETLVQNGRKVTSRYCKQRWCVVCNRIRIAKMINGYKSQLEQLEDPQLVTLTIPNCNGEVLPTTLTVMQMMWRKIYKKLKRTYELKGVKKLECTYNAKTSHFHPHYHFIVQGEDISEVILQTWRQEWKAIGTYTDRRAQDIKPITNENGYIELFKYFTKLITKVDDYRKNDAIFIPALDVIFTAMKGRRVYEPFGIKAVSDDIDELCADKYEHLAFESKNWQWENNDWWDCHGKGLTGYTAGEEMKRIMESFTMA